MLQEFRVDNFKSLINIVFKPQGVNLLLGENNSGKTSLCQALRFVSRSSVLPLDACVDEVVVGRSRLVNFTLDKATTEFYVRAELLNEEASGRSEKLTFEYELTISSPKATVCRRHGPTRTRKAARYRWRTARLRAAGEHRRLRSTSA